MCKMDYENYPKIHCHWKCRCWFWIRDLCAHRKKEIVTFIVSHKMHQLWNSIAWSHAHTVVWECCKDDRQSQWGMAKFDPQPTLIPWTDRHQIWNTWLRRGYLLPKKIWAQSAHWILPSIYPKYTPKTFECLLHFFFSSSEPLQRRPLDRFSRLIRHTTWFCARKCLLGWE